MAEITMLTVANRAEIQNGNLYGLGIGWNWTFCPVPPMSLVVRTHVSPSRMSLGDLTWNFVLSDADGQPVDVPLAMNFEYHAGATMPNGSYPGAEIPLWAIFHFAPIDLKPGRYQWRVTFDDAAATYPFTVVDPASTITSGS